ncbi:hypothetical protein [Paraburkholderia largidicola]|uniref:Uncharacterized protein n=1 Tax=Paraburkholderia largidicola TaxID=3014751 RepID=A0A7I8C2V0_9BURK|nr:hypothetical protein [Paraburkholderia sp. PGU16]BCF95362.1 hypothetical protein PPGU16_84290 [Paraburkholderia sp. PGU16]
MVSRFELTIHTAHGSITSSEDANSVEQIAANMPRGVTSYTVYSERERPGVPPVDDMDLWLSLDQAVRQLEYASTLTPEVVAELEAEQLRALAGLAVEFREPVDNPAVVEKLRRLVDQLNDDAA